MTLRNIYLFKLIKKQLWFFYSRYQFLPDALSSIYRQIIAGNYPFEDLRVIFNKMGVTEYKDFDNVLIVLEMLGELEFSDDVKIPKKFRHNLKLSVKMHVNLNKTDIESFRLLFAQRIQEKFDETHTQELRENDKYYIHNCAVKFQIINDKDSK